ncbi:MAG TPA: hypothetical protein VHV79_12915 [Mycobacteriales bacterium]|nr:hypothetical protein [Mycobacteriales bacterium]
MALEDIKPTTTFEEFCEIVGEFNAPADHPRTREMYSEMIEQAKNFAKITAIPECPDWCSTEAGHAYSIISDDHETFTRIHELNTGRCVSVFQDEHNRENVVTVGQTIIWISLPPSGEDFDGDGARALASELVAAAYKYDEITAAQR